MLPHHPPPPPTNPSTPPPPTNPTTPRPTPAHHPHHPTPTRTAGAPPRAPPPAAPTPPLQLWCDKHTPACCEELAVQKRKVQEVQDWLQGYLRHRGAAPSRLLLVTGALPPSPAGPPASQAWCRACLHALRWGPVHLPRVGPAKAQDCGLAA